MAKDGFDKAAEDFAAMEGDLKRFMDKAAKTAALTARRLYRQSFKKKKFIGGTQKWKPVIDKRTGKPKDTPLRESSILFNSLEVRHTGMTATVSTPVKYAKIHNEGGKGNVTIRKHRRRLPTGKTTTVKSHSRKVNIPQRQFMDIPGQKVSPYIRAKIQATYEKQLEKIFNKHIPN